MSTRYIGGLVYNPPGGWSGLFNGSSQYLSLTPTSALNLSTNSWTIEMWVNLNTVSATQVFINFGYEGSTQRSFILYLTSANVLQFAYSTNGSNNTDTSLGASGITTGTWNHLAVVRNSTTITVYRNGVAYGTTITIGASAINYTPGAFRIGVDATNYTNGYISNCRLVNGTAVYTSTFTPPTGALLPITNTSLLTCRYPTFIDGSTNGYTITNNGTATVSTSNPFPTTVLPNPALGGAGNGIYTLSQYASLRGAGTWPAIDPYYKNVALNLHGNAGAVLPFNTDASTNNFQVTQVGDTRPSNYTPFQGNGYYSNYFSSVSDYLGFSTITLGSSYTIEFFVNFPTAPSANNVIISNVAGGGGTNWIGITSSTLTFSYGGTNRTFSFTAVAGTWYYVQVIGTASTVSAYVNGSQIGTTQTGPTSFTVDRIGGYPSVGFTGYLSNLRVTNAANAVSSTPTSPLTAITNCVLLTCQSNRFIDNSASPYTLTPAGSISVNPLQPFTAPTGTSAYGSGFFDGAGDYLSCSQTTPFSFGTGDFCVETWVYITQNQGSGVWYPMFDTRPQTATNGNYPILGFQENTKYLFAGPSSSVTVSSYVAVNNTWLQVVWTRVSGVTRCFINGVLQLYNGSDTTNYIVGSNGIRLGSEAYNSTPNSTFPGYFSNYRVLKGGIPSEYSTTSTTVGASIFTPPTTPLTAITNTSLLTVQTNAPSQNNTFLDSSTNNWPVTPSGNATQGTFSPYGPNWSNFFDGSGDYLSTPSSAAFAFGTGDFTLEAWIFVTKQANSGSNNDIFTFSDDRNNCGIEATGTLYYFDGSFRTTTAAVSVGVWSHVAYSRSSGTMSIYLNGTRYYNASDTTNQSSRVCRIGTNFNATGSYFNGYVSNMRVLKGTGLYTGTTITVPVVPLTAITNTQLLTCQSNRFIDNSSNALTLTPTGETSVQRFNPFVSIAPYSASVIGGSAYFDGSSANIITTNTVTTIGTQDFCLEAWVYAFSTTDYACIIGNDTAGGGAGWFIEMGTARGIFIAGPEVSLGSAQYRRWFHVVFCRVSNTYAGFVNGVRQATGSLTTNYSTPVKIGINSYVVGTLNKGTTGYIADGRVTIGSSPYSPSSTTLTVPTAPLTAVTGTVYLASMTNAAVLDNAMMNDLQTVGNAQLSTSVKKYGSASMYFDGSGDNLSQPSNPAYIFNTGDITIEAWIYFNVVANATWVTTNITSGFYWQYFSSALSFGRAGGGTDISKSWSPSANAWYHVATVRSGSTVTHYVNGISIGSGTFTDSISATTTLQIGTGGAGSFNGYIDDLRITKVARYTANFQPPTSQVQDQ